MSKDKNIEMKQAYVGNKSHIKCEFGEFIQPLTVTNNKNVTIQGLEIATEKDNVINKNIPYRDGKGAFGICKNGGNCQFKAMEKVKWENVNENVYVGDARTLNGKSFFRCPYVAGQNIEIIEHNQQAIGEFSEKNKNNFWDEAIQMEQQAILMLMKLTMEGKDPLEELRNSFTEQLIKELGYAAEVSAYTLGNDFKDLADSISKVVQNPSLETFSDMSFATNDILSDIGIPGANFFLSGDTFKSLKKLSKNGKKYDVSINGMIDFMNDNIDVTLDEKLKPMSGRKISPEANRWDRNTYKQMVLGNGTEEMTLIGTIGEFVNGIIPISGQLADARDVVFSANKGDGLGVVLSGIGLLPGLDTLKRGPKVIKKMAKKADEAIMAINKAIGINITPKILDSVDEIAAITKKGAKEFTEAMGEWVARNRKALSQLVPNSMIVSKMDELQYLLDKAICFITQGKCFVEGTLVRMEYGYKNIEDIVIGEKVLSFNINTGKLEYKKVLNVLKNTTDKTMDIKFDNNTTVESTEKHPFYLKNKGFVEAKDLKINDGILSSDGKSLKIVEIKESDYFIKKEVYNLYVEDNHNYFVTKGELLVHNRGKQYTAEEILKLMEAIGDTNDYKKILELIEEAKKSDITKAITQNRYDELMDACFVAGTKILSKGNKTIEKVCVDDYVFSYNEQKNIIEEKIVKNIFSHKVSEIYKITIENSKEDIEKLKTTKEHRFYSGMKYVAVEDLKIGMKLFSVNDDEIKIINIEKEKLTGGVIVYNIEVKDNHNYFVGRNKILVHNKKKIYNKNNPIPKDLLNGKPKNSKDISKHFNNGGEIAIKDDGTWIYGLPKGNKVKELKNGNYAVLYKNGKEDFLDHKIARVDYNREYLNGTYGNDFQLYNFGMSTVKDKNGNFIFKSPNAANNHLYNSKVTREHAGDGFDLVSSDVHGYFTHKGEASKLRNEGRADDVVRQKIIQIRKEME